ncbi:hypothetical protein ACVXZZ_06500 [Staphylococcus aureus]
MILPYHLAQDEYEERLRGDNKMFGNNEKRYWSSICRQSSTYRNRTADLLEKETFERLLKSKFNINKHISKVCLTKHVHHL